MHPQEGRRRVVIEGVQPEIDCGRFPIKRVCGEEVVVEADIFTDGHDQVSSVLLHRAEEEEEWNATPMEPLVNDRWRASFVTRQLGRYHYTLEAWVDHFLTWYHDLEKRVAAGQDVAVDLMIGATLIEAAIGRADASGAEELRHYLTAIRGDGDQPSKIAQIFESPLLSVISRYPDRSLSTRYGRQLEVVVDPLKARFSSWYELFPRSTGEGRAHGRFRDVEKRLPYVAGMGFDVLYLPPIHPIGRAFRKGRNNVTTAGAEDVGSPWAIGGEAGGHLSILPELGTMEDFVHLVREAKKNGLEIALDIAFQVSPDHPYVKEHPEWFLKRPDGTIQYAENPPKKYQDIYPFNFETEAWQSLWNELRDVFLFWIDKGVRIFRVDNPHTKALSFWEWCIDEIKRRHPDVIFLSEAFTRPKVMYRLAKCGFSQSYTYFAWRRSSWEITRYFEELNQTAVREFFRPNAWPNTPDILTDQLQYGGRPAFIQRLVLAATLSANYGIYGPAFELQEHVAREPGSEEYLDSEKYQIREWNLEHPESLRDMIVRINRIRRTNPALQADHSLRFHPTTNDQLLCYSKTTPGGGNVILTAVNLDPHNTQSGFVDLKLDVLGLDEDESFQVHDLIGDARYSWQGSRNYLELNPWVMPAHVFRIRTRRRSEQDFEYYL